MRRKSTTRDLGSVDIPEPERVMLSTLHSMLTIDMNEIRSRIRAARISRGWSLAEFADHSAGAITAVAMGSYERGGRTLSTPKLLTICHVLQISLVHLLASEQDLKPSPITDRHIYDLRLLQALPHSPEKNLLLSYIREIIKTRGDWKGEVISLRKGDIENLERIFTASEEVKSANYPAWVEAQRISLKKS